MEQTEKKIFIFFNEDGKREIVTAVKNAANLWMIYDMENHLFGEGIYKLIGDDDKTNLLAWSPVEHAFVLLKKGMDLSAFNNAALIVDEEDKNVASLFIWVGYRLLEHDYGEFSSHSDGIRIGELFYPADRTDKHSLWHRPKNMRPRKGLWRKLGDFTGWW